VRGTQESISHRVFMLTAFKGTPQEAVSPFILSIILNNPSIIHLV